MPEPPADDPITLVPDWVCEVLSASNARYDRTIKFPVYARVGVPWLWVVDPREQTLEVRKLAAGVWTVHEVFGAEAEIRAEPFAAIALPLGRMWLPVPDSK
jgi:Uma2 family endonuclease